MEVPMITREKLKEWGACYDGAEINALVPEGGLTLTAVLDMDKVPAADRVWVACYAVPTEAAVRFARWVAGRAAAVWSDDAARAAAYAAVWSDDAARAAARAASGAAHAAASGAASGAARQAQLDWFKAELASCAL